MDYCYETTDAFMTTETEEVLMTTADDDTEYPQLQWIGHEAVNLGECQGDCDEDADCVGDLVCWQRDYDSKPISGCSGDLLAIDDSNNDPGTDYCYDANEYASICTAYCDYTAAPPAPQTTLINNIMPAGNDFQHRPLGFDGFEDVDVEPFSIVLSAKDLLIAVLAATTVICMVIIYLLIRKGGVGMNRKYEEVVVFGDSEMEELQR